MKREVRGSEFSSGLTEKFEVAFARDSGCTKVVLDDEDRDAGVLGNDYRARYSRFGEGYVIAFNADALEAVKLEDSLEGSVGTGLSFSMLER